MAVANAVRAGDAATRLFGFVGCLSLEMSRTVWCLDTGLPAGTGLEDDSSQTQPRTHQTEGLGQPRQPTKAAQAAALETARVIWDRRLEGRRTISSRAEAQDKLRDMVRKHRRDKTATASLYRVLIREAKRLRDARAVSYLWEMMQEDGIPATVTTWATYLECVHPTKFPAAYEAYRAAGIDDHLTIYNAIIRQLSVEKQFSEAFRVYALMLGKGFQPSKETFRALFIACRTYSDYRLTQLHFERAGSLNYASLKKQLSVCLCIEGMRVAPTAKCAKALFEDGIAHVRKRTEATGSDIGAFGGFLGMVTTLVTALSRLGDIDGFVAAAALPTKYGARKDGHFYTAVVVACTNFVRAGKKPESLFEGLASKSFKQALKEREHTMPLFTAMAVFYMIAGRPSNAWRIIESVQPSYLKTPPKAQRKLVLQAYNEYQASRQHRSRPRHV
eukprot:Rhum_TRINITY_DN7429_c0_g1::Rhum_TRINITY_DN7429_c0_g1_i1::g.22967::m.22967